MWGALEGSGPAPPRSMPLPNTIGHTVQSQEVHGVLQPCLQDWPWPRCTCSPSSWRIWQASRPPCWVCTRCQGARALPLEASMMTGIVTMADMGQVNKLGSSPPGSPGL